MDEREHPHRGRDRVSAVASAEQGETFAILRRPQLESDQMPESRWKEFDGGPTGRRSAKGGRMGCGKTFRHLTVPR
jgi:hypothetical protein